MRLMKSIRVQRQLEEFLYENGQHERVPSQAHTSCVGPSCSQHQVGQMASAGELCCREPQAEQYPLGEMHCKHSNLSSGLNLSILLLDVPEQKRLRTHFFLGDGICVVTDTPMSYTDAPQGIGLWAAKCCCRTL